MGKVRIGAILLLFVTVLAVRSGPVAIRAIGQPTSLQGSGSVLCSARPIKGQPPLLAIVIDDLTTNAAGLETLLSLDQPLTFAVLPDRPDVGALARRVTEKGHEVILHLPMDAGQVNPDWYVGRPISARQSDEEIQLLVSEWLQALPEARGMNNHMGTVATQDERVVRAVLEVARKQGKFVLDSLTTERSVMPQTAEAMGVPCMQRSLFLDHESGKEVAAEQLRKLADWAEEHGAAIGIGHVGVGREGTAEALKELLPELKARGIRLVTLSELLRLLQSE